MPEPTLLMEFSKIMGFEMNQEKLERPGSDIVVSE